MAKVKWGSIDESAIAEATTSLTYVGPLPKKGVYRFKLRSCQYTTSSNDNPMLKNLWLLDGSWRPEHEQYDGCPVWDNLPVMESTAFRVKAFCDALGVSYRDFLNKTIIDEDKNVKSIGSLKIQDEDLLVCLNVDVDDDPEYGERLVLARRGGSYIPVPDEDEDEDEDDEDYDEDDEEEL